MSLLVYGLHGFHGLLAHDQGVFVYGGEQVARGVPPYSGIFNSVGPLADALPGLAIRVSGMFHTDPVLAVRLLFVVLAASCCAALCVLARDVLGSRAAGLLAPAVFLLFQNFSALASDGPREKTAMVLFLLLALVLLVRRRWWGAGACTALATLTWQPSLVVAVAGAVVAALLLDGSVRFREAAAALLRFAGGGLLVAAATAAWFAAVGGLRQAVEGFVVVNLLYTRQPSAYADPAATWKVLWGGYHLSLVLALVGLLALLVLAAVRLARGRRSDPLVVVGAAALTGTVWTALVINGAPDLFVLLPFSALGASGVVLALAHRIPGRLRLALVAGVVTACVVTATVVSVTTRDDTLLVEQADVAAVLGTQPASATVLSVDAPEVMAIANRTNPTSYQMFDRRMRHYLAHTYPGGMAGFAAAMTRLEPTFVAVAFSNTGGWVKPLLREHYRVVGTGTRWTWYLNRSAGHEALLRARAANAAAMSHRTGPVPRGAR